MTKSQLTWHLSPRTIQLPQRHKLFSDLAVPIDQNRRGVPLGISFNAHIRTDLAELDVAELGGELSPEL